MTAAARSGPASAPLSRHAKEHAAEPFLLESVLGEIQLLRTRFRSLAAQAAAEAAQRNVPAWQRLSDEVTTAQRRAERLLLSAAERDGVHLLDDASANGTSGSHAAHEPSVGRFRRWARELEEHCACVISHANALGLERLAQALAQCRRDLIGLEQPLIAANAAASERRK
jgi:hypothetical protein